MTHNPAFLEKDVLTNLLWSMIPETRAFCPKGLGIVPYAMPSSVELARATIEQLKEYDVVMWEKHGVCAVGPDIMEAFDQIDVLSKSAQSYLTAKSMGFEPTGTTPPRAVGRNQTRFKSLNIWLAYRYGISEQSRSSQNRGGRLCSWVESRFKPVDGYIFQSCSNRWFLA